MSMIRKWLAPPQFDDDEMNRRARVLVALLWPTTLIGAAILIGQTLSGASVAVLVAIGLILAVCVAAIYLVRRGRVTAASLMFVFSAWFLLTTAAALQDGLTSPFIWFTMVILLQTGLILDRRYLRIITALTIAATLVILLNHYYSFLPPLLDTPTPIRRFISLTATYLMLSVMVGQSTRGLRTALVASQEDRKRLQETNRLLQETQAVLEERVEERTNALEQRALQLQASVEVGAAITSMRDLSQLLNEVSSLIATRLSYYHVGIYLLDSEGRRLELRSASSRMGRDLIASRFSLDLNEATMATSAARTRTLRVAADVRMDDQYRALDEFSRTRSEITLPLISGEKLLGVLDLQDERVNAPSSDDLATLKLLANQTAIAIDNAQLLETSRQSLESLQRAYGAMSREGWQKVLRTQAGTGYRAVPGGQTIPAAGEWKPEMAAAQSSGEIVQADGQTLAVPIKIRDQVAGVVRLCKAEEAGAWRGDEIALVQTLSDRLSAALEGARLYEETRRRAERERLTGEITARLRASNDPQTILEVAARELRKALQADKAQLVVQAAPVYNQDTNPAPDGAAQVRDGGSDGNRER